jgi:hypothetical protein
LRDARLRHADDVKKEEMGEILSGMHPRDGAGGAHRVAHMLRTKTLAGAVVAMPLPGRAVLCGVRTRGILPADDVSVGVARGEGGARNRSGKDGLENKPVDGAGGKSSSPFPQLPKPSRAHQANRHLGHIPVNIGNAATFGRSRLFLIVRRRSWEPCPEASVLMMSPYLSR